VLSIVASAAPPSVECTYQPYASRAESTQQPIRSSRLALECRGWQQVLAAQSFAADVISRIGPLNLFDPRSRATTRSESALCWLLNLEHKDARAVQSTARLPHGTGPIDLRVARRFPIAAVHLANCDRSCRFTAGLAPTVRLTLMALWPVNGAHESSSSVLEYGSASPCRRTALRFVLRRLRA
jgi:hypothetical protein